MGANGYGRYQKMLQRRENGRGVWSNENLEGKLTVREAAERLVYAFPCSTNRFTVNI
jgi:hypothetical protein